MRELSSQVIPDNLAQIGAPAAWAYSSGVGTRWLVVDFGYDRGHEDLPMVPVGNCSLGSYNGCDDEPLIGAHHGTGVSGVGLARDNSIGIVGVAPGAMPSDIFQWGACTVVDPVALTTGCYDSEAIAALNWAALNLGALGVVNMSFSGDTYQPHFATAVAAANAAGHVLVASAGNTGRLELRYPAAYTDVFGVGGVQFDDSHAPTSTRGPHVDFSAPYTVLTTLPGNNYGYVPGNSYSAPAVGGLVALLRSRYPFMDRSAIFSKIRMTAKDLGPPGWDEMFGFGRIRADLAVAFDCPSVTASVLGAKPRMTWGPVPYAVSYRVYRRVTPFLAPQWALWDSTTSTSYTDYQTKVLSFYGYGTLPPGSQVAVSYYVAAWSGDVECGVGTFMSYLPNGAPPL